ncbi:MAG: MBL fold metallo-hydrolase [Lachnospiraceae bacterium]|jgi:glyoxylase-like metal-dependent hydrolase (beta-lactamase superfamily II)|nr:MBL fold metallo-hydrolase [Lachnospiraceae bacterium]
MNGFDFYSYEKLNSRLYVIHEKIGCNCYNIFVATGSRKSVAFDAGMGFTSDLRNYIERNIAVHHPIECYLTHGDIDHIGSAVLFDSYYLNHRDYPQLKYHLNPERLFAETGKFCGNDPNIMSFIHENYVHKEDFEKNVRDINNGDTIDLGNMKFEVYKLPGHTPGSLAFFNREENYAIVGDAILTTSSFGRCKDYQESFDAYNYFISVLPYDVVLYSGHGTNTEGISRLLYIKQAFKEIIEGRTQGDEHFTLAFDFLPKELMDPEEFTYDMWCHRTGTAVVPYNANALKKEN